MSEVVVLDDLFNVSTSVELAGKKIYLKILSEADWQARDLAAMTAARAMRKRLRNPADPFTQQNDLGDLTKEEMIETLHQYHDPTIAAQVSKEVIPLYVPYPEKVDADPVTGKDVKKDLDLSDRLDVQDQREQEMRETIKVRAETFTRRVKEYDDELQTKSHEELLKELRELQLNAFVSSEYLREQNDQTILMACYSDDKCTKRFFKNVGEIKRINPAAKRILLETYQELDGFDLWQLKN